MGGKPQSVECPVSWGGGGDGLEIDPSRHHVACTKYRGSSPNTFYSLEAYGTH